MGLLKVCRRLVRDVSGCQSRKCGLHEIGHSSMFYKSIPEPLDLSELDYPMLGRDLALILLNKSMMPLWIGLTTACYPI